jgi:hypothetical protein
VFFSPKFSDESVFVISVLRFIQPVSLKYAADLRLALTKIRDQIAANPQGQIPDDLSILLKGILQFVALTDFNSPSFKKAEPIRRYPFFLLLTLIFSDFKHYFALKKFWIFY